MGSGNNPWDDEFLRVRFVLVAMLGAFLLLGGWLWHIQVRRGPSYEKDQIKQSIRRVRIPGVRGRMFDRAGVCLADNRPSYGVALYLEELRRPGNWDKTIDHVQGLVSNLESVLGLPAQLTREDIRSHIRKRLPLPLVVWRDLTDETLARFAEQASLIPGVDIQTDNVRLYPGGPLAAHVLGYVGRADIEQDEEEPYHYYLPEMMGRSGLEKSLDPVLRGEAGGRLMRVDVTGFRKYDFKQREPVGGKDVMLTLDARVQHAAEEALGGTPGAVVVMDPQNGDVLAMVSSPAFDPNRFVPAIRSEDWSILNNDPYKPLVNRAAAGGYAPGSTFKPVTALAALESHRASAGDLHNCPGYFQLGRATFRCWYHTGHNTLNMRQALERSCNVYFFNAGLAAGIGNLHEMATRMGLGSKTGIELDYEIAGLVPDEAWKLRQFNDGWRDGDTCNVSIGQGALVTSPLQMAVMTSLIANGGHLYRPRLVRGTREAGSGRFALQEPELLREMGWAPENIQLVRNGLKDVINGEHGTARRVALPNVTVAGKTGTAEFGRKEDRQRHAWMIAFAPFEKPRYAIVMLVDEGISGGETAAPRMQKLLSEIFNGAPAEGRG
jgi:penicillin-binding protein 2